jgi:hypothetical protein
MLLAKTCCKIYLIWWRMYEEIIFLFHCTPCSSLVLLKPEMNTYYQQFSSIVVQILGTKFTNSVHLWFNDGGRTDICGVRGTKKTAPGECCGVSISTPFYGCRFYFR